MSSGALLRPWLLLALCGSYGCQGHDAPRLDMSRAAAPATPFDGPATPTLCAHPTSDAVRDFFCGAAPANIHGLGDLEQSLGIAFTSPDAGFGSLSTSYADGGPLVVLLGHSTALSGELVSPLNPRAIIIGSTTVLAFNRGVQQAELASRDRNSQRMNFYLVQFEQACNASTEGCSSGDLFTPRIESSWTRVAIRDDEELKNTPSDCRQCHQRGLDEPVLLMRELNGPWTHFFAPDQESAGFPEPSGSDLTRDYVAAKGDEPYAGIPSSALRTTLALLLESAVTHPQPLLFEGAAIMTERWPFDRAAGAYPSTPVRSATWDAAYEAFKRGEQLALPYFEPRATDPAKQARLTDAYSRYRSGASPAEALPDMSDVFPDDAETRAEIGLETEPGATPAQALVQACGPCHNDVLDQSISRARFNVGLSRLARAELDQAVARLKLPPEAAGRMPPPGRRQIAVASLNAVVEYLKRDARSAEDDAFLARAAELGMAGNVSGTASPTQGPGE